MYFSMYRNSTEKQVQYKGAIKSVLLLGNIVVVEVVECS